MKRRLLLGLLVLSFLLVGSSAQDGPGPIERAAAPYLFSLARWEATHFPEKWLHLLTHPLGRTPPSSEEMEEFFALGREMGRLASDIQRAAAEGDDRRVAELEQEAADVRQRWAEMQPHVEEALEGLLSGVIRAEGLTMAPLGLGSVQFPPVDLRFGRQPLVLAVSPRDRIELLHTVLLRPDMTVEEKEEVEGDVLEREDLSALVVAPAAIATYPAVIDPSLSLRDALVTGAHEWAHHYLWFYPLGRSYFRGGEMVTVNETLADLVGKELGAEAVARLTGEPPPTPGDGAPPPSPQPGVFDFNREMRETRLGVQEYLDRGDVEGAEAYLEQRRQVFLEHGYYLRKLNQAYFAFYGSYATGPASVSPVGKQLEDLRSRFPTLAAMIKALAQVGTYGEYLALLERYGVPTNGQQGEG